MTTTARQHDSQKTPEKKTREEAKIETEQQKTARKKKKLATSDDGVWVYME